MKNMKKPHNLVILTYVFLLAVISISGCSSPQEKWNPNDPHQPPRTMGEELDARSLFLKRVLPATKLYFSKGQYCRSKRTGDLRIFRYAHLCAGLFTKRFRNPGYPGNSTSENNLI